MGVKTGIYNALNTMKSKLGPLGARLNSYYSKLQDKRKEWNAGSFEREDIGQKVAYYQEHPENLTATELFAYGDKLGLDEKAKYDVLRAWIHDDKLVVSEGEALANFMAKSAKEDPFFKSAQLELEEFLQNQYDAAGANVASEQEDKFVYSSLARKAITNNPKLAYGTAASLIGLLSIPTGAVAHQSFDGKSGKIISPASFDNATLDVQVYSPDDTRILDYIARLKKTDGTVIDSAYAGSNSNSAQFNGVVTAVEDGNNNLPSDFAVSQNYPNPFNPSTNIEFNLSKHAPVTLTVYNALGQEIRQIVDDNLQPGKYIATWGGENDDGNGVSAGAYFARLTASDKQQTVKMLLMDGGVAGKSGLSYAGNSQSLENRIASQKTSGVADASYVIEIDNTNPTEPQIVTTEFPINLSTGATNAKYRIIVPTQVNPPIFGPVPQIELKQKQEGPYNSINLHDSLIVYDNNGDVAPDTAARFSLYQPDSNAVKLQVLNNKWLRPVYLNPDTSGDFNAIVRAISPHGGVRDRPVNIHVQKIPLVSGTLVDYEGNPREGYVMLVTSANDTTIAKSGVDGSFTLERPFHPTNIAYGTVPTIGSGRTNPIAALDDTIKAHIINDRDSGFVRIIPIPYDTNDVAGLTLDAVPALADTAWIGLDTLKSFIDEANLEHGAVKGLKKANLDSLKDVIASVRYWASVNRYDTLTAAEQLYIKSIIEQKIDTFFNKPSQKYLVPQDSTMLSRYPNTISWFKKINGQLGSVGTIDYNNDGILDEGDIQLLYIKSVIGPDTFYIPDRVPIQEGLSARVAPGEVGIISSIPNAKTVLHQNTTVDEIQPADKWLIKIAEHYAPLTQGNIFLIPGDFKSVYDRLGNNNTGIVKTSRKAID